jgi:prepilin-type N-terminal cleavage/methylation domain-containing protein
MGRRATARNHGFTLMEIMIVVVVLALLATMAIPRFADNDKRRFKMAVEQVADLLTMFAQRQMLEDRLVGISYDPGRHAILLVRQETHPPDGLPPVWEVDPYVQPVLLPDEVELIEVSADGDPVDIVQWPLASAPQEERPAVSLTLESPMYLTTISLAPQGITPEATGLDAAPGATAYQPVDLDSAGRTRDTW